MGKPGRQAAAGQRLAERRGAGLSAAALPPAHVPALYLSAAAAPPPPPPAAPCAPSQVGTLAKDCLEARERPERSGVDRAAAHLRCSLPGLCFPAPEASLQLCLCTILLPGFWRLPSPLLGSFSLAQVLGVGVARRVSWSWGIGLETPSSVGEGDKQERVKGLGPGAFDRRLRIKRHPGVPLIRPPLSGVAQLLDLPQTENITHTCWGESLPDRGLLRAQGK